MVFHRTELANATGLHALVASKLELKLLLQHAQVIEAQARSGTQRRFKEALDSLETDTPNIELLIHCINKIVFSESREANSHGPRKVGARNKSGDVEQKAPATLAIDVSEVKHSKAKKRLTHSGDFAYLLDTLIYHLTMAPSPLKNRMCLSMYATHAKSFSRDPAPPV